MTPALALAAKLAVLGGLVAVGASAAAIAPTVPVASAAPGVWLDAPATASVLPIGTVTVLAHSTGTSSTDSAELEVDGHFVRNASSTAQTGTLTLLSFDWTAKVGTHHLVVSVAGLASAPRTVIVLAVSEGTSSSPVITPTSSTHPSPSSSRTAPAPSSPTPTSTTSTSHSRPPPSTSHHTTPPASPTHSTTAPPLKPTVGTPTASNSVSWCDGSATITVTATGASAVSIQVSPGGPKLTATRSGNTWTAHVDTSELPPADFDHVFEYSLVATATGPGGTVHSSAGALTMTNCKP
jgi:hypothetical protein